MSVFPFVHLHVHSAYSLAEGAIGIKRIPQLCLEKNFPAVALTDTGNLFGALEFACACSESGIQPIIGCQIRIRISEKEAFLVLLVQNEQGYRHLLKLVSLSYLRESTLAPHIVFEELKQWSHGLIALTGSGILEIEPFKDLLGNRLYIELTRHGTPEEKVTEPKLLDLAIKHDLPIVATNDVYFETPLHHEAHDALLCIADGRYISEVDRRKVTPMHHFASAEEMIERFSDLPEAIENTVKIAQRCSFMPKTRAPILPAFPTERSESEDIRDQAFKGLAIRLGEETLYDHREVYEKRLEEELNIIDRMGFSGYFLIVSDFIKWAKNHGIPVGPGRGSGAGSLVAWSLTITDMDPIRFQLIFERFLNPERISMPDFDIDFCQDRRDEVIQYVRERYGADRVAHIITFGKLQARAVVRDVGRVLQMPYGQVDRLSKLIPHNPANPVTLAQALEQEPALKEAALHDEMVKKLIDVAQQLEGLYRHASTHAAGVVIGDRPLDELVPLYKDQNSILPATQFNMKWVEAAGLVKFDFLGLKTLTIIERCCAEIRRHHDPHFTIQKIPLDDPKTFALLCRVETVGVFQLESAGMRDVLRKLRPDRFEDIIALVALYRPGPMDDIPRYLACKHGEESVTYLHPDLRVVLESTYGVMVYQEQVMKIAQILGGYSLGAADLLRRAMGKKIPEEMEAQRDQFVKGAIQRGVSLSIAQQIFDQMAKFAGYGFNKSHSAPYALLAYQTAYLKANFVHAFFASTMSYDAHNTDKLNLYRQDLERYGIRLLPPDVNRSDVSFSVEGDSLRYALCALKNVGEGAMQALVNERNQNGLFRDVSDFVKRLPQQNKRQWEGIVSSGALDSLYSCRRDLFENSDRWTTLKEEKQRTLFGEVPRKAVAEWSFMDKLQKEFEAIGFYLSAHPLDAYQDALRSLNIRSSSQISASASMVTLAGVVLSKQERLSKTGNKFAFLTLSDSAGVFEIGVFSNVYINTRELFIPGNRLWIQASPRQGEDALRLVAQDIQMLESRLIISEVRLFINDGFDVDAFARKITEQEKGHAKIICLYEEGGACLEIVLSCRVSMHPTWALGLKTLEGVSDVKILYQT